MRTHLALVVAVSLVACGTPSDGTAGGEPPPSPGAASVTAEIVGEPEGDFTVGSSEIGADGHHEVLLTWNGPGTITLDDARFTHHVEGDNGDLFIAGRGCGWNWWEPQEEAGSVCTADLMIIEVASGDTHAFPVTLTEEVGPLRLGPGTYVAEERVAWWEDADTSDLPDAQPDGTVAIRLTYEVG